MLYQKVTLPMTLIASNHTKAPLFENVGFGTVKLKCSNLVHRLTIASASLWMTNYPKQGVVWVT